MELPPPATLDDRVVSKVPGKRSEAWMAVLATGALVLGAAIGIAILTIIGSAQGTILLTPFKALRMIVVTLLATIVTLLAHEALHGAGMLVFRARPSFGAGIMAPGMPYLYTTSDGHLFTRWQYIVVAALPNVAINAGLAALIAFGPHSAWWVVPFSIHLSGGVGDAWLCWAALTEPRGTLVEDLREGVRVHRPVRRLPAR